MLKRIWLLLFLSLFTQAELAALTVTSLNIRWYGKGGDLGGGAEDETRNSSLREFLFHQLPYSDVFVFQEITEIEMLKDALYELNCQTYVPQIKPHQHIVTCTQPYLDHQSSANYNIQLKRPRLRPALVSNLDSGVQIIGLHLKASPRSWKTRQDQINSLSKTTAFSDKVIVIGDYNTYRKKMTGAEFDDSELFQQILSKKAFNEQKTDSYTYVGSSKRIFDRVWTRGLKVEKAQVFGPCNPESVLFPYNDKARYLKKISDHCAIQITVKD